MRGIVECARELGLVVAWWACGGEAAVCTLSTQVISNACWNLRTTTDTQLFIRYSANFREKIAKERKPLPNL